MFYIHGQKEALRTFGLSKEAVLAPIRVSQKRNPFTDVHKKLEKAFKLKVPKFDTSAMMKRLLNNPLKQPRLHISGKTPPIRM